MNYNSRKYRSKHTVDKCNEALLLSCGACRDKSRYPCSPEPYHGHRGSRVFSRNSQRVYFRTEKTIYCSTPFRRRWLCTYLISRALGALSGFSPGSGHGMVRQVDRRRRGELSLTLPRPNGGGVQKSNPVECTAYAPNNMHPLIIPA